MLVTSMFCFGYKPLLLILQVPIVKIENNIATQPFGRCLRMLRLQDMHRMISAPCLTHHLGQNGPHSIDAGCVLDHARTRRLRELFIWHLAFRPYQRIAMLALPTRIAIL